MNRELQTLWTGIMRENVSFLSEEIEVGGRAFSLR
jgi:hypothetical protein